MHPRLSVNQASSWHWTLDEDLAFYEKAGITAIGVDMRKLRAVGNVGAAAQRIADTGLTVTNLVTPNPFQLASGEPNLDQTYELGEALDAAKILRPEALVVPAGSSGSLAWEDAADALETAIRGTIVEAQREGIWMLLAFASPTYNDISFVHTLHDAIELGWRLDMGVCMDVTACWYERNLIGTIHSGIAGIGLVKLADDTLATYHVPNKIVPGDGAVPLDRVLRHLVTAGYQGMFDLELRGRRIDDEGYASAIRRSIRYLEALFEITHVRSLEREDGTELAEDGSDLGATADAPSHLVDAGFEIKYVEDIDPDIDPESELFIEG